MPIHPRTLTEIRLTILLTRFHAHYFKIVALEFLQTAESPLASDCKFPEAKVEGWTMRESGYRNRRGERYLMTEPPYGDET